eukprot:GHVH01004247.1.p1 GENE.GHVH01004247.1~~GHVH01004247.1.p1  ORF type:complete len:649 (+),score=82.11 GHVH01004247.1:183-2129(+)
MEWTKESEGNTLAYDSTASLFYGATILSCILIPWSIRFVSEFIRPNAQREALRGPLRNESYCVRRQCECSKCIEKNERMISDTRMWRNLTSTRNIFQFILLTLLWCINLRLCYSIISVETLDVGAFKPFVILGISEDSSVKEIKKAYRYLSLQYHPDRNPDDIDSAAIFLRISKAYNALTDETARKNFERFGNPDGPGNMKVGLGLPKWIVQEENQLFVLCLFFIIFLFFIPLVFISMHNEMKKYSASGVRVETLQFLSFYMHDGTRAKLAPEFLAASAEARDIPVRETDADTLAVVEKEVNAHKLYRQSFTMPSVTKNFYLIICHMMRRHELLDENLRHDLEQILISSPLVTQSMLELAFVNNWLQTVQSVLEFRRSLLQAMNPEFQVSIESTPVTATSLLQIPCLTREQAQAITKLDNDDTKIRSLRELVRSDYVKVLTQDLPEDLRPSPTQLKDILIFIRHIPDIEIIASIGVEGEEFIVRGDIATCTVNLTRFNLKRMAEREGVSEDRIGAGAVHCPYFPGTKFEEWFIFLSEETSGHIVGYKRVQSTKVNVTVPIQFRADEVGEKNMVVFAMCDSYSGLDTLAHCTFKVLDEEDVEREVFIHPEDAGLDDEPNLVQTFMGDLIPESDESESEDIDLDQRREVS